MKPLLAAAAALALLLPGCAPKRPPATAARDAAAATDVSAIDAGFGAADENGFVYAQVYRDPPRDSAHPARNQQLLIPSGPALPGLGRPAEMNALFFLAAGEGAHPTMLLLHGLPGNERNLDLAQAVRRSGWNVLTFTYRGAWGSEGRFSIEHAVEDAGAALAFLRSPAALRGYGIDPGRIVVAGHSMGGFAAAAVAAGDGVELRSDAPPKAPLAGLILLDAWDIARSAEEMLAAGDKGRAALIAAFDDIGHSLGPVTAADLADELARRGRSWDLRAMAPQLARLPLLTVYATQGDAAQNKALAAEIARACPVRSGFPGCRDRLKAVEIDSDHSFADSRIRLAAEVVGWLQAIAPR
jgi:pimeloyl-ACP methyl ester carboxylesterase